MDAIQSPVITLGTGHGLRRPTSTRILAPLARIAVGIAWATVTVTLSLVLLEASFGYTHNGTQDTPPQVTRALSGPALTLGQETPSPSPGRAPWPAGD